MKKQRIFLSPDFEIANWETLKPYFEDLSNRKLLSASDLRIWFQHRSELESVVYEDAGWRYIRMTCDTKDKDLLGAYEFFITAIEPEIAKFTDILNKKAIDSPYISEIESIEGYDVMLRELRKDIRLFRDENVILNAEIQSKTQRYGAITGSMMIEHEGEELTMQQAGVMLEDNNRVLRQTIFMKVQDRRLQDKKKLDALFSDLINLRDQVAHNAGFANFRDYKHESMGRFDYKVQDCLDFHDTVEREVVPLLDGFSKTRKTSMGLDELKPWDKAVDAEGRLALKPFTSENELIEKTIKGFNRLDPYFGDCLSTMKSLGHLDLFSRKGKAPGGYNYPLAEIGIPFIFMNATSTLRDLVTIVHEGGHAIHSFLSKDLELNDFRNTPSEVAELASMSMELISMDVWDEFFEDKNQLKEAKEKHLEQTIETLAWVATIDKFQHWLYLNPKADNQERDKQWLILFDSFSDSQTSWKGLEEQKANLWQKQLHLYEVPFYYIEYGMAQLGAIALWKRYKENPADGILGYKAALALGYKKPIDKIYRAAGIEFRFDAAYIKGLMDFVQEQLNSLSL